MASLRQHYESIKGNKKLIGGALGFVLGVAPAVGALAYSAVNRIGAFAPEPTYRYSKVIEIESKVIEIEKELNESLKLRDVDSGLIGRVDALRTELEDLLSEAVVKIEKKEFDERLAMQKKIIMYTVPPIALAMVSSFPFSLGYSERKRKLKEIVERDNQLTLEEEK